MPEPNVTTKINTQEITPQQKIQEKDRIVAELRSKYPWAIPEDGMMSSQARAAKNLKQELTLAFPGVAFSVKSKRFSGGNSIHVKWDLGPTPKQVGEIADKYKYARFDGMTDSTSYNSTSYGLAVGEVLGRAGYVSWDRTPPYEMLEVVSREICRLKSIEYQGPDTIVQETGNPYTARASFQACDLISKTSFPASFSGDFTVEINEAFEIWEDHWAKIVFTAQPEPANLESTSAGGLQVIVRENEVQRMVEVIFSDDPSKDIRESLESFGFRYSDRQHLWYARRSERTLQFARSLEHQSSRPRSARALRSGINTTSTHVHD